LPPGGSLTYTIAATVATAGLPASINNVASVNSDDDGVCLDRSALSCQSVTVTNPVRPSFNPNALSVPTLDTRALAALAALLGAIAAGATWRRQRARRS
jgi:hypothetical protein